jgi:hypothetical protein
MEGRLTYKYIFMHEGRFNLKAFFTNLLIDFKWSIPQWFDLLFQPLTLFTEIQSDFVSNMEVVIFSVLIISKLILAWKLALFMLLLYLEVDCLIVSMNLSPLCQLTFFLLSTNNIKV